MFIDGLSIYQDYDFELPIISDDGYCHFDFIEGIFGQVRQSKIKHEGSFSTSISVQVQGNRVVVEGNLKIKRKTHKRRFLQSTQLGNAVMTNYIEAVHCFLGVNAEKIGLLWCFSWVLAVNE